MKNSLILFILLAGSLAACNNTGKSNANSMDSTSSSAINKSLFDKEWNLLEVNDKTVVLDTTFPKKPFLVFEQKNHQLHGNLGCNGFGTTFELKGTDEVILSPITATQMACPNLQIEQDFLEALENIKKYQISEGTLILKNSKDEILAKLSE